MSRHHTKKITKLLVLVGIGAMMALGCELIVDFDRTKIPVEASETGPGDSSTAETSTDATTGTDAADAADAADASDASDASDAADAPDVG